MAKYHINPRTGKPGACKAKIKCMFGDLEGDHYESKEAAQEAYERQQKDKLLTSIYGVKKNTYKDNPNRLNVFQLDDSKSISVNRQEFIKYLKDSGVNSFKVGRITKADDEQLRLMQTYQNTSNELVKNFLISYTMIYDEGEVEKEGFSNPKHYNMHEDLSIYDVGEDFKAIGCGVTNNAYLHEKTGMVYKVPNGWSRENGYDDGEGNIKDNLIIKEKYEKLNGERISEEYNIDYAKTYFMSVRAPDGDEIPVQVQEYLDPSKYGGIELSGEVERELNRTYGDLLGDFHPGNILENKETGRIVLIDCIVPWNEDDDPLWWQ